jgi:ubiquinone/menaquinone biosynthesis C-methylase UbiE
MPFEDSCFYSAMVIEVMEHCTEPENVLKEIYSFLKPGSIFFLTVPFLCNLHEVPHDEYGYIAFSLERNLKNLESQLNRKL